MSRIIAVTLAASMALGGAALAKGHDQGVADGSPFGPGPGAAAGQVDDGQKNGQRGAAASSAKGDNRTTPVDQPGQNK